MMFDEPWPEGLDTVRAAVMGELSKGVCNGSLDAHYIEDIARGTYTLRFEAEFLQAHGKPEVVARTAVPLDWWQAFRGRWFPDWWLDRHPVKQRVIETLVTHRHLCPHLEIPDRSVHAAFLRQVLGRQETP